MVVWKKETVKNFNGEEVEITLKFLGGRARDLLLDEYIKTKFKAKSQEDKEADIDYRPYTLKAKVMETYIVGINADEMDLDDYDRIFDTYYSKSFREVFGGGDLKNSETTSEPSSEANT